MAASCVSREFMYRVVRGRAELPLLYKGHRIHGIIWARRDLKRFLVQPPTQSSGNQPRLLGTFYNMVQKASKDEDHTTCPCI